MTTTDTTTDTRVAQMGALAADILGLMLRVRDLMDAEFEMEASKYEDLFLGLQRDLITRAAALADKSAELAGRARWASDDAWLRDAA